MVVRGLRRLDDALRRVVVEGRPNSCRRCAWVPLEIERCDTGRVRRRHRRPADRVRRRVARIPGRGDAQSPVRTSPRSCRSSSTTSSCRSCPSRRPSSPRRPARASSCTRPARGRLVAVTGGDRVVTPSPIEFCTAVSSGGRRAAAEAHVRHGRRPGAWFPVTQSIPAITPAVEPLTAAVEHADGDERDALGHAVASIRRRCRRRACRGRCSRPPCRRRRRRSHWSPGRRTRCGVMRMPVSMMYAVTPAPVAVYVYVPLSGRARWSIRSRPQVARSGSPSS